MHTRIAAVEAVAARCVLLFEPPNDFGFSDQSKGAFGVHWVIDVEFDVVGEEGVSLWMSNVSCADSK
jgi:hypothetical protein